MSRILFFLAAAGQLYCIYDAFRRKLWLWVAILVFFPGFSAAFYFFLILLPEINQKGLTDQANEGLQSFFFPEKELEKLKEQAAFAPSFKNKMALADGYQRSGKFEEALSIYTSMDQGPNKQDPTIWKGIAYGEFQLGNFSKVPAAIANMRKFRSSKKPTEFDLLMPQALEEIGDLEGAAQEYKQLAKTYSGDEARCRYAMFLQSQGKEEEAKSIFEEMIRDANASPQYYKKAQKVWLNIARRELKS